MNRNMTSFVFLMSIFTFDTLSYIVFVDISIISPLVFHLSSCFNWLLPFAIRISDNFAQIYLITTLKCLNIPEQDVLLLVISVYLYSFLLKSFQEVSRECLHEQSNTEISINYLMKIILNKLFINHFINPK